jgi:hypothetical protein
LTSKGSLPSGETFQYSFYVVRDDLQNLSAGEMVLVADAWQNALKSGGTPLPPLYGPATIWSAIVADTIDAATGKVVDRAFGTVQMAGTGSGAVSALPPGVAIAVTLRTILPGPTGRGRFYLPPPLSSAAGATGRLTPAAMTTVAGALANAFTNLAGLASPVGAAVYSIKNRSAQPCSRGDVGDVFDSQRSRRDKLVEARSPVFTS